MSCGHCERFIVLVLGKKERKKIACKVGRKGVVEMRKVVLGEVSWS